MSVLLARSSEQSGQMVVSPPGSFPLCANPAFESEAVRELEALAGTMQEATRPFRIAGLLLTGSLARGEGVITRGPARQSRWLSDVECLVVVPAAAHADLPAIRQVVANAAACANDEPRRRSKGLKVDVSPILAPRLAAMRPAIFTRELLDHAKLLWGRPNEITMPRGWPNGCAVLRADAFRLLNNRIMEYVAARSAFESEAQDSAAIPAYALSKFWVEMGTSLSAFLGCYRSSYRERQATLTAALSDPGCVLDRETAAILSKRYEEGMAVKLGAMKTGGYCSVAGMRLAADIASRVWWWETERLLGDGDEPARPWWHVVSRLRRIEPAGARLRDWARLLLRTGVGNRCPAALSQAIRAGSMGSAIYSGGCLLCFFWDEIGSESGPGPAIVASLSRLLGVREDNGLAARSRIAERLVKAWTAHLRSAPL